MNLNRHYLLPLLIAMLLIPAQDLSAKKKKQVKEHLNQVTPLDFLQL